jgi:hypothetical protein
MKYLLILLAGFVATISLRSAEREAHAVGVYSGLTSSGETSRNNEEGAVSVVVNRPGKAITLALSAYEPVVWTVSTAGDTTIEKVILLGYYAQRVQGLPAGVEVVPMYAYSGNNGYFMLGYSMESAEFLRGVPKLFALTGLELSSFQGAYGAGAFTVDAVQTDPRLLSTYPEPTPAPELPSLNFSARFFSGTTTTPGAVATVNYTLQGPQSGGRLLPGTRVVPDGGGRFHYGVYYFWEVLKVDAESGTATAMHLPTSVPELSWPIGVAYDSQRDRVVLGSLGGEGFLYGYDPNGQQWGLVSSLNNNDFDCLEYHPADDTYYGVRTLHLGGFAPAIARMAADGTVGSAISLPQLPFGIGPSGYVSEVISVGDYLVLLLEPREFYPQSSEPQESRIYLIDPRSGQVWLTYRSTSVRPNQTPTVQITWPANGSTLPEGNIELRAVASDPDGAVQTVSFLANNQSLGTATRSNSDPNGTTFALAWSNVTAGAYSIVAMVVDNQGASAVSSPVNITVSSAEPPPPPSEHELHVIGVYEGYGTGSNHEEGQASVQVNRPGAGVTLVLSSYEPTLWTVSLAAGTIEKVILAGYYTQRVQGLADSVEVVHAYPIPNGTNKVLYIGYTMESGQFLRGVQQLCALTGGMDISSFQGVYEASQTRPFVVDRVQLDARLRCDYPQPVLPSQLPDVRFQVSFYDGSVFTQHYSLTGAIPSSRLLPAARALPDNSGQTFYSMPSGELIRINAQGGTETLSIPIDLPELSWPMGFAFDSERSRALLVSLGGEGYLYAYTPAQESWSVVSSMNNVDLESLVYHAADDSLYGVQVYRSDYGPGTIYRFNAADGSVAGQIRLPVLPFDVGVSRYNSQLVSVGDYLVWLLEPRWHPYYDTDPTEARMYLIDPRTGQVSLTYRQTMVRPNAPPTIALTQPANGTMVRVNSSVRLSATAFDAEGPVSVEFIIDGQRFAASGNGSTFAYTWTPASAGSYTISAIATDAAGATAASGSVQVRAVGHLITAQRSLPDSYRPGQRFSVFLRTAPVASVTSWTIEERPPLGWEVGRISDGGRYDAATGTVRWTFRGNRARMLNYQVTAPRTAAGRQVFAGTAIANGVEHAIAGDTIVNSALGFRLLPQPTSRVGLRRR